MPTRLAAKCGSGLVGAIHSAWHLARTGGLHTTPQSAGASVAKPANSGEFGTIDVLIAGAAGNFPAPVLGMSANGFKAVIDIDLLGTFNVCRAAHQFLTKPGASVIAISAGQADTPMAYQAHVCAAKAGVNLLIQSLALEWGPDGIRLNCIAPGPTEDTEGMRRLAPTDEHRAKVLSRVPLGRYGTKDELADLALFLSTPASSYISGSILRCDGASGIAGRGLSV